MQVTIVFNKEYQKRFVLQTKDGSYVGLVGEKLRSTWAAKKFPKHPTTEASMKPDTILAEINEFALKYKIQIANPESVGERLSAASHA